MDKHAKALMLELTKSRRSSHDGALTVLEEFKTDGCTAKELFDRLFPDYSELSVRAKTSAVSFVSQFLERAVKNGTVRYLDRAQQRIVATSEYSSIERERLTALANRRK